MKDLYITCKYLDSKDIETLNKLTHNNFYNNNSNKKALTILKNFIATESLKNISNNWDTCYISSGLIEGVYMPNSMIESNNKNFKFVCVVYNGVVMLCGSNYYLLNIVNIDLKNTLILEGRGCNTHLNNDYINYRFFAAVTATNKKYHKNPYDQKKHLITKYYFEICGGLAWGYYRKNNNWDYRKTNEYILNFDASIDTEGDGCWGIDRYQNIFKQIDFYIDKTRVKTVTAPNGKKYAATENKPFNTFIKYTNENILKLVNYTCKTHFKKVLSNVNVYDKKFNSCLYN